VYPVGIGLRDPRSQKRDLGHPSISPFDIAEGTSFVIPSEADLSRRAVEGSAVPQTLPGNTESRPATNLSSRPERSAVERSAVSLPHRLSLPNGHNN
jgi:hypothetical protein